MKKFLQMMLFTVVLAFFVGCGGEKGPQPVEITGIDSVYKDEVLKFSINYPNNWTLVQVYGEKAFVFSDRAASGRFKNYDPTGAPVAQIIIRGNELDSTTTIDTVIKRLKKWDDPSLYKTSKTTIDGKEATKIHYEFPLSDGQFVGEAYVAQKDSTMATVVIFESFADTWETYSPEFDKIIKTVKLAETPESAKAVNKELPFPSSTLTVRRGEGYSIPIPENFDARRGSAKDAIFSRNYIGERRLDCNIQVDVLDASKSSDLKKITDETKKKFGDPKASKTKLGGKDAYVFSWKPNAEVYGRVYLVLHNNKLYKVSMNWFKGEQKEYLPIFEQAVKKIKFN